MYATELITGRRSIRKFTDQPVSRYLIEQVIAIARYAPSWKNSQTVRYYAVFDELIRERIAEEAVYGFELNQKTLRNAPALVLLTTVEGRSGYEKDGSFATEKGTHWQSFDAGIAAQTFCLAAWEQGLGTVILGLYSEEKLHQILPIRKGETISAMIAVGFPAIEPEAPKRKSVSELLTVI